MYDCATAIVLLICSFLVTSSMNIGMDRRDSFVFLTRFFVIASFTGGNRNKPKLLNSLNPELI